MRDVMSIFQKALIFLLKPGNALYVLLPVAGMYALNFVGGPSLSMMLIALFLLLMTCKLLDGAARIMQGLGDAPVPLAPLTVLPPQVAGIVLVGMLLAGLVFGFLVGMVGASGAVLIFAVMALAAFLLPLWLLAVSYAPQVTTLFAVGDLSEGVARIGVQRYVLAIGLPLALGLVLLSLFQVLIAPLLPDVFHLHTLLAGVLTFLPAAVAMIAWAYLLEDEAADADYADMDFSEMDFSDIVMDSNLLAAMAEGRADDIPEGDISPVKVEKAPPAKAEKGGLMGRLRKKEAAAVEVEAPEDDADDAEALAGLAALAETARKPAPPDMSLLAEADVRGLDMETQLLLARDLAEADRLWQDGDLQGAQAILQPYTGYGAPVAAYFPAFKRLDRIYRQQNREAERHELHARLLAAAAQGFQPAYHVVHAYVGQHDAAALEADWILPLAQYAAAEGHYDNVLHLTKNFARNHPNHRDIADNYFLAARALEKQGNLQTAEQLLAQLVARYPDHGKIAQIRATHGLLLEKMKGA